MTENPFAAELQRRRLARSATITPEKRIRALELFAVSPDGHRLEALRKISAPLADWSERKHEANLEAKAKAWDLAEQKERSTAVPIESEPLSVAEQPNYTRASDRQILRERQAAAVNRPPQQFVVETSNLLLVTSATTRSARRWTRAATG